MKRKLKTSLITSYVLLALISTILISILANIFLENQFKDYVINNQKNRTNQIIASFSKTYIAEKRWDVAVVENIGVGAMEYGMIVSLYSPAGKKLWDAREHNNGICEAMIKHMSQNMISHFSYWKGGYMEETKEILVNSKIVGTVKIGYYGPYFFTDNDLAFLKTLNEIIILVGVVSLVLAVIVGIMMASNISRPIVRVISTAQRITKGHYKERINENSKIIEINELTGTINNLAENLGVQETLRKKLTGDVAHELRTPLTTLQTHMEAILDGVWEPSMDRIESCYEEIIRINRLVGDLEKVARFDCDNMALDKTKFDLKELTQKTLMNFQSEAMNRKITLSFEGEQTSIIGDKDKITQVLVNLLSNALKYTPDGGRVQVLINSQKDCTELFIKDNGIGIAEEDLPHIFERFYRADKSRSRKTGGSGIGLTITKAIVDAHGGEINVLSKLGEGTEFYVKLKRS